MLWKGDQSPRVVFSGRHMDNVRKETHVVSVMTDLHKKTCAMVKDEKDDLPSPNSKAKTDEGGEKTSKTGREECSTDTKEHNSVPLQKLS